jgi:L-threonylcarbamoyladenylate synthase
VVKIVQPSPKGIADAARALVSGAIIAYPTETVYGLGVDPFSDDALGLLFSAKGRDEGNPILLIVADLEQLNGVVSAVSERARAFADAFWPGPLSLLLPKSNRLPDRLTAGKPLVCVRCPACPVARSLCQAVGGAITSTSANRSGHAPARSLAEIDLPGVAIGIDGGVLAPSPPSTVFDPETGQVLRAGTVSAEALATVGLG